MCTSDLTTWIGIDGDWYRVYVPSVVLEWPGILELAETEEELLDYLKDVSEFTRNEKGPLQFEIDEQLNTTWYKE